MKYQAFYTKRAARGTKRAGLEMRRRPASRVEEPCESPHLGKQPANSNGCRDGAGSRRIIYGIGAGDLRITIRRIGPRGKACGHRRARLRRGRGP